MLYVGLAFHLPLWRFVEENEEQPFSYSNIKLSHKCDRDEDCLLVENDFTFRGTQRIKDLCDTLIGSSYSCNSSSIQHWLALLQELENGCRHLREHDAKNIRARQGTSSEEDRFFGGK